MVTIISWRFGVWEPGRFDKRTDKDQRGSYDRRAARKGLVRVKDFDEVEQANGFSCNPHGMMTNTPLRRRVRPTRNRYDPMHVFSPSGIGPRESCRLLDISLQMRIRRDPCTSRMRKVMHVIFSRWHGWVPRRKFASYAKHWSS